MATTYTRDKSGKMQVTKRTGMDSASFKFGNAIEKLKSGASKVKKVVTTSIKKQKAYKAKKEIDGVTRAFGSVDNYVKMYPDYSERAKKLKKQAYDN